MTLALGKMARPAQRALLLGMQVVAAAAFLHLAWIGLDVIEITGSEVYPITGVSARWAYLALIVGFAAVGVTALTTFARLLFTEDPLAVRAHHAEEEL